jgi:hypothetical protein
VVSCLAAGSTWTWCHKGKGRCDQRHLHRSRPERNRRYQRRSMDCCSACRAVCADWFAFGSGFGGGLGLSFMVATFVQEAVSERHIAVARQGLVSVARSTRAGIAGRRARKGWCPVRNRTPPNSLPDPAAARKDKYAAHVSQTNVKAHHLASTSQTSEPLGDPTATRSHPATTIGRVSGRRSASRSTTRNRAPRSGPPGACPPGTASRNR